MRIVLITIIIFFSFSCNKKPKVQNKNHILESNSLSLADAEKFGIDYYKKYASEILLNRSIEIKKQSIEIDGFEMKYHLNTYGDMPINGWSLFISLHGGGGVSPEINERQWNRHKKLYSLEEGILLTPRSPTDTWNMWHQDHIDRIFNRLIQNMIAKYNVNPNKIFLLGYSAGGDGVYQLAPRMADRFAAASMSAGHPNDASPLGLRNIGFSIHMGKNDSAYNRNNVAEEWKVQLEDLKSKDIDGYENFVKIYEGRGHQISHAKENYVLEKSNNGVDSSGIFWMSKFTRNPYPKKVVWKQDDVTHNRFYWLKVIEPKAYSLIVASIESQVITISNATVSELVIRLNDKLLDMDKKVKVVYRDKEIFSGYVPRRKDVILNSINEYGDPTSIYYGEISVLLGN